jgi:hypothetical protein
MSISIQKKSQLTIIIIAALALLLIASFFLFSASQATKAKASIGAKQSLTAQQDFNEVISFVQSCLDTSLKNGLETIGKQGGVSFVDGMHIQKNNFKTAFGIIQGLYSFPTSDAAREDLRMHAETHFKNCAQFGQFLDEGLTMVSGELESTLVVGESNIGSSDISFTVAYPLTITNTLSKEETTQSKFSTTQKIRLAKMLETMQTLLSGDAQDISFDITTAPLPSGMSLRVEQDPNNPFNDLITLTDGQSLLGGVPYELRTARQNRNPVLSSLTPQQSQAGIDITTNAQGTIVARVAEGTAINKALIGNIINYIMDTDENGQLDSPLALDPDEDTFTPNSFSYFTTNLLPPTDLSTQSVTLTGLNAPLEVSATVTDGELTDSETIIIDILPVQ